jgi:hypothetical protein
VALGAATTGVDAALASGGSISGTVTDSLTGLPLEGVWVEVFTTAGGYVSSAFTDASGHYTVGPVLAGDYRVGFFGPPYMGEWWNDQPDFYGADPVSVADGASTLGIDAALARGGSISGTVTDSLTGLPLVGVGVSAYSLSWEFRRSAYTDASGQYTVDGLAAGDYHVEFSGVGYAAEWWDNEPDFYSADPVSVALGAATTGVDAALASGGSISGTVTDSLTGLPLEGVGVDVFTTAGGYVRSATTDVLGQYTVGSLGAGDYHVLFWRDPVISEWWDDQPDFDSADPVTVALGMATTGIDAALGPVVPGAPWGAVTTGASGEVTVWFNPPLSDGGAAVSDYVVLYRLQGGGAWTWFPDAVSASPHITVTGLANGAPYEFEVAAINAAGLGPWSEVAAGTPIGP